MFNSENRHCFPQLYPSSSCSLSPLERRLNETAHLECRDMRAGRLLAFAPKALTTYPYPDRTIISSTNQVVVAVTGNAYAGQRCAPEKADWLVLHWASSELNVCSIIARTFAI